MKQYYNTLELHASATGLSDITILDAVKLDLQSQLSFFLSYWLVNQIYKYSHTFCVECPACEFSLSVRT